jgi:hypothetical protein
VETRVNRLTEASYCRPTLHRHELARSGQEVLMTVVDALPPRTLVLRWHAPSRRWHGAVGEDVTGDAAVGRAGPAGVVAARIGHLAVSQCYLTGLVEQVWLPPTLDEAQRALLRLTCEGVDDLTEPRAQDEVRSVTVLPFHRRTHVFRWARLAEDRAVTAARLNAGGPAARYLAVEWVATLADIHVADPDLGLGDGLRSALAVIDDTDPLPVPDERDLRLPDGRGVPAPDRVAEARTALGRAATGWRRSLLACGEPDAERVSDLLDAVVDRLAPAFNLRGTPRGAVAASVEPPRAVEAAPRRHLGVVAEGDTGLEPGPSHLLPIGSDGRIVIDDATARRSSLEAGATASLRPDGDGWYRAEATLSDRADPGESRWVVTYEDLRDTAVSGAAPLSARDTDDPSRAVTGVASRTRPRAVSYGANPWRRPGGPRGLRLVDTALDAARRAARLDTVALGGHEDWAVSAAAWLDAGAMDRAAWAWSRCATSDDARQRALEAQGVVSADAAATSLAAIVATGRLAVDREARPPAWVFAAAPTELEGDRGDA